MINVSCTDYAEMSLKAMEEVVTQLRKQPRMLLCVATGNSPMGMYRRMAARAQEEPGLFREMHILKLDEWVGLQDSDPASCEAYIRQELLEPLGIPPERYIGFDGNANDLEGECKRIDRALKAWGSIDCCILGLGTNGHLGFNEPEQHLEALSHVTRLSEASKAHGMVAGTERKPQWGITLGMAAILQSHKIILLLTGKGKSAVTEWLDTGQISTSVPASFLWLHPNTICLRDMESNGL